MYASSGGTFNFPDHIVQNVHADPASIAMFNDAGSGQLANNFVAKSNDAISSNHSRGVRFLRNIVVQSASGIHTDNAEDGGVSADVIRWNSVLTCTSDGSGIWDLVPYLAPTIKDDVVLVP